MTRPPLVVVTVGADGRRFDRLTDWIDSWFADAQTRGVRCVVRHGTGRPAALAESHDDLAPAAMHELMRQATVVVTDGSAGSVQEARRAGRVPIVVPRSAELGEHVDDSQQARGRELSGRGLAILRTDAAALAGALDDALGRPSAYLVRGADATDPRRPTVLLLAGSGRSGSTLLERALSGVPGVTALGETVHLWERGLRDDELCSCERPFHACPFWAQVGEIAFGGWHQLDAAEMAALRQTVVRTRYLPAMLLPTPKNEWRLRRDHLGRLVGALLGAAQVVSGARLILDSSKLPAYAGLLRHAHVDLRCVRVVRDPRGVAHSLGKTVTRPEATSGDQTMYRLRPSKAALWWSAFEVQSGALAARGVPMMTAKYEDFVADPVRVARTVLAHGGIEPLDEDLVHLGPGRVELPPGHLVAGNPMRFVLGPARLRPDEAWREAMPARDRWVVSALTSGFRQRHGYR